jgi:hypothetical protein
MAALLAAFQCFPLHHAAAGPGDGQAAQEVPWPTSWWPLSTPEDQGMDSASLARLIDTPHAKWCSLMIRLKMVLETCWTHVPLG